MAYKVICENDDYIKEFENETDAYLVYLNHYSRGHKVSMVSLEGISNDLINKNLARKGIFNSAFRISKQPLGIAYNIPTAGSASNRKKVLETPSSSPPPPNNSKFNFYFEKLVKLVPSEIIGLYLALYSLTVTDSGVNQERAGWVAVICFVLVFVSRLFGTKITGYETRKYFKTAQWKGIFISAISFVIWVYAMGHSFPVLDHLEQFYVQAAVIIWTFVVPLFYNGED